MQAEFDEFHSWTGRHSIPPERLLRAQLLQALYSVCSERLSMEELNYNILFRWFVGMNLEEKGWAPTVLSRNRDRSLTGDVASRFSSEVVRLAREERLLSDEHLIVDATTIEAWVGHHSLRRHAASAWGHAAVVAEPERAPQRYRWPNGSAPRLPKQPGAAADDRTSAGLAQEYRRTRKAETPRSGTRPVELPLRPRGLQPRANAPQIGGRDIATRHEREESTIGLVGDIAGRNMVLRSSGSSRSPFCYALGGMAGRFSAASWAPSVPDGASGRGDC